MVPKIDRVDEATRHADRGEERTRGTDRDAGIRIDQWEARGRTSSSFARSQPDPAGDRQNRTESAALPRAFDEVVLQIKRRRIGDESYRGRPRLCCFGAAIPRCV